MFSVSFTNFLSINFFLLMISHLYLFEFFCIVTYGRSIYWYTRKILGSITLISFKEINFYVNIQLILIFTLKISGAKWFLGYYIYIVYILSLLIFFKILLYLSKSVIISKEAISTNFMVLMLIYVGIANIYLVKDLVLFLFILELIGITYYFFFLNKLSTTNLTFLKYKNLISFYLWTSFLVLIAISVAILITVYNYGTLYFSELNLFTYGFNEYTWQFLLFSLLWKIGAPGYHFFKLQIYQFLPLYTLLLFSVVSLFINFLLLQFMLMSLVPIFFFSKAIILVYLLLFNFVLLLSLQSHLPFYDFFGYSSINTLGTVLLFGLI